MGDFFRFGFENKLRSIFVTGLDALKLGGGVVRVFQGAENHGLVSVNRACFVFVSWVLAKNGLVDVLDVSRFAHLGNYRKGRQRALGG